MFKELVGNMLSSLPKNRKRQIFLASFAALLKGVTTFDRETYKKLDRVLSLAESSTDALAVPVILSKVIWNGKTSYEVCQEDVTNGSFTSDRITHVVGNILNNMPKWMLYGTTEEIEADVAVILKDQIKLLGT